MASNPACRRLGSDGGREALQEKKEREGVLEGAGLPQPPVYPCEKTETFREHKRVRA